MSERKYATIRGGRKNKKRNKNKELLKKRNQKFQRKQQTTMIDTMNEFEEEDNEFQTVNTAPVQYKGPKQGRKFLSDHQRIKMFGFDPHKDKKKMKNSHKRSRDENFEKDSNKEHTKNAYILAKQARYRKNSDNKEYQKDIKSFTPEGDDYDYEELAKLEPRLKPVLVEEGTEGAKHKYTLNWKDKGQSYYLNKAILQFDYGITNYDLPEEEGLVPAVPSRRDYIYWIHDLFADQESLEKPLRGLDIGVGANCIYPILGHKEFGWTFVGSDISQESLDTAQKILDSNNLSPYITLKLQSGKRTPSEHSGPIFEIFENILSDTETSEKSEKFDFTM